jgi:hypothetical protein
MADERWERLAEQLGVAYAKTVAEAMNLKLDMDNSTDREKLRRAVLDLVAGRKCESRNGIVEILSFWQAFCSAIHLRLALSWGSHRDNLSKAGWSWGYVSAVDSEGRTIWIADAHCDGKRFVVHADEILTAFLELESVTRASKPPL